MNPHCDVSKAKDGSWYWVLIAGNGEIVCTSEMFPTRSNAVRGIRDALLVASEVLIGMMQIDDGDDEEVKPT